MTYIKLKAQRLLIGKNSKAFLVSILPFLMTLSLLVLNICFLFYLYTASLNLIFKTVLAVLSLSLSAFIKSSVAFMSENHFYKISTDSFSPVTAKDLFCAFSIRILKSLLFVFLSAVFFLPSAIVGFLAYYVKRFYYSSEVTLTLVVSSIIMALVGFVCFFVIFKRFSKSYYVQFATGETNPLKVLSQSSEMMEENLIRYSLFCTSFLGWDTLCLLLFPIIYVLPYRKSAKYVFFNEKKKEPVKLVESEKPIVFILNQV